MTDQQQQFLLQLARNSIDYYLQHKQKLKLDDSIIDNDLKEKKATFVTLHDCFLKLRGCIGNLQAIEPLYLNVINNAINAAFFDPRFSPLNLEELKSIKIEISILDRAKKIDYQDSQDLLTKLNSNKIGVIISYQDKKATFLPQVWDQVDNTDHFLSSLCLKAGLNYDFYKTGKLTVATYQVIKFSEK